MARVTVEDCLEREENRFALVVLAAQRTRQLMKGSPALVHSKNKAAVTALREPSLSGVPIVAITAEGDRDTSFAVGCDGFIQKPIDARSFASTVRRYLGGHREPYQSNADVLGERLRAQ